MKISYSSFLLLLLMPIATMGQSSAPLPGNFDRFLNEVFTGEGKITENSRSYVYFKELYTDRIEFQKVNSSYHKQDYIQILDVPLNTEYNKQLKQDLVFNPSNFNPFKYNINFYSKRTQVFLLGNSGYIMIIHPQKISSLNRL